MNHDEHTQEAMQRVLRILADRFEAYLDGDDLAFETLGEALEQARVSGEELHAVLLVLRSLTGAFPAGSSASVEASPGKHAHRVWSDEERESVTPEAWGFLLDLRRRGSLDPEQFERVLDVLTSTAERPADVGTVREVAARVALRVESAEAPGDGEHGEIAH
jgi:uncharacterized protein Smg (DUF494 family)